MSLALTTALACSSVEDSEPAPPLPAAAAQPAADAQPAANALAPQPAQAEAAAQPQQPPPAAQAAQPAQPKPAADPQPAAPMAGTAPSSKPPLPVAAAVAQRGETVNLLPLGKPFIPSGVRLDGDQTLRWPTDKRGALLPWEEGSQQGRAWMRWTYMPLLHLDSNDDLRQGLALSYDVSEDSKIYTMHLDPAAIWHDGTAVTADQLKASWEFGSWPQNQASWGGLINYIKMIEGMEAVGNGEAKAAPGLVALDDHTLQITLAVADYIWPIQMTMMMLGFVKVSERETDSNWWKHPMGTGPFDPSWDPDSTEATLVAASNYWREQPSLHRVEMPVVTDAQTQFIMYENGEIDLSSSIPGEVNFPDHKFNGEIRPSRGGGLYYFALQGSKAPLDDPKVRAAIAHGADFKTFIQTVLEPLGIWSNGPISPSLPCYDQKDKSGLTYDVEKARRLLAESTYGSAANLPPITVGVRNSVWVQVAELWQEQLRGNLGVNLNIMRLERGQDVPETVNVRRRSKGQKQPDVAEVVTYMTYSKSPGAIEMGIVNDVIDAHIVAGSASALDDPARCESFVAAERGWLDNYYGIPLMAVTSGPTWLVQPWVLGLEYYFYGDWITLPDMQIAKRTGPR